MNPHKREKMKEKRLQVTTKQSYRSLMPFIAMKMKIIKPCIKTEILLSLKVMYVDIKWEPWRNRQWYMFKVPYVRGRIIKAIKWRSAKRRNINESYVCNIQIILLWIYKHNMNNAFKLENFHVSSFAPLQLPLTSQHNSHTRSA